MRVPGPGEKAPAWLRGQVISLGDGLQLKPMKVQMEKVTSIKQGVSTVKYRQVLEDRSTAREVPHFCPSRSSHTELSLQDQEFRRTNRSSFFCLFLPFLGPIPRHIGGSQARGLIGAVATGLRQSHSNAGSEPHLQPTPQLTAMMDP